MLGSIFGEIVIDYNGAGVKQATADLAGLNRSSGVTSQGLQTAGRSMLGVGAALGAGLGGAVIQAANFEQQMDAVNASLGGVDQTVMTNLTDQALDLGAATQFSAGEVAGVQEAFGKMGVSGEQLLSGATQAALDLSAATGEDLVVSAQSAAASMNLFGLEGQQVTGVADTMTAALNNSSATLPALQAGITTLGSEMVNLERYAGDPEQAFQDTAAAVAYFSANGLKAQDAGISLARGMQNLANTGSEADQWMSQLGISAFDLNGNFLPLPDLFDQLQKGMAGLSDETRTEALTAIFGAEAVDVMSAAIRKGGDPLREYEALMVSNGQAAEQAAIRMDNLKGAWETMMGSLQTAAIALGTPLIGPIRAVTEGITGLLNGFLALPGPIQSAIAAVGVGSAALLVLGGAGLIVAGKLMQGVQAFQAMNAASGGALLRNVGLLSRAFLGVGAAIGLGVLAYQTNFLGFGDAVDGLVGKVQSFGTVLTRTFDVQRARGLTTLGAALSAFGIAAEGVLGLPIQGFFDRASQAVETFSAAFKASFNARSAEGVNVVSNAIKSLGDGIEAVLGPSGFTDLMTQLADDLPAVGNRAADVIYDIGDAFRATSNAVQENAPIFRDWIGMVGSMLLSGDIAGAVQEVAGGIGDITAELAELFKEGGIDIPSVLVNIGGWVLGAIADFGGFLSDVVTGAGSGAGADLHNVLVNILSWARGQIADFAGFLRDVVTGEGSGAGADLHGVLVNIASWARGTIADFAGFLQDIVTGQGSGVGADLHGVLVNIGSWARGTIADFAGFLNDIVAGEGSGAGADLHGVLVNITSWARGQIADFAGFLQDIVSGQGSGVGADLNGVLVNIGSWARGTVADFAGFVQDIVTGQGSGTGATLNGVLVNVASWARGQIADFAGFVQDIVSGEGGGLGADINGVLVNIASWARGSIADLSGFVQDLVTGEGGGLGAELNGVLLNIASWAQGQIAELGSFVQSAVDGIPTIAADLTAWTLNIAVPTIQAAASGAGDLFAQVTNWIQTQIDEIVAIDPGSLPGIQEAGQQIGQQVGEALVTAISAGLSGDSGGVGVGDLSGSLESSGASTTMLDGIRTFLDGFLSAIGTEIDAALTGGAITEAIGTGSFQPIIDFLVQDFQEVMSAAQTGEFWFGTGEGPFSGLMDGLRSAITAFTAELGQIGAEFEMAYLEFNKGLGDAINSAASALVPGGDVEVVNTPAIEARMAQLAEQTLGIMAPSYQDAAQRQMPVITAAGEAVGQQSSDAIATGVASATTTALPPKITSFAEAEGNRIGREVARVLPAGVATGLSQAGTPPPLGPSIDELMAPAVEDASLPRTIDASGASVSKAVALGVSTLPSVGTGPGAEGAATSIASQLDTALAGSIGGMTLDQFSTVLGERFGTSVSLALATMGEGGVAMGAGGPESAAGGIGNMIAQTIGGSLATADFTLVTTALQTKISEAVTTGLGAAQGGVGAGGAAGGDTAGGIGTAFISGLAAQIAGTDPAPVAMALQTLITTAMTTGFGGGTAQGIGGSGATGGEAAGGGIGTSFIAGLAAQITATDPAPIAIALQTLISTAMTVGMGGGAAQGIGAGGRAGGDAAGGIGTAFIASLATQIAGTDPTPIATALQTLVSAAMAAGMGGGGAQGVGGGGRAGGEAAGGIGTAFIASLAAQISGTDPAPITTALQTLLTSALSAGMSGEAGGGGVGASGRTVGIGASIVNAISSAITSADFSGVGTALQTQMTTVIQTAFTEMQTVITTAMAAISTAIQTGTQQWVTAIQTAMTSTTTAITSGTQEWTTAIQTAATDMQTAVTTAFTEIQTTATTAIGQITTVITSGAAEWSSAIQTAGGEMSAAIETAMGQVVSAVTSGMAEATSAVQQGVATIVQALNEAASGAEAAGAAVGEGFANGIESMLGRVEAAAASLASAAKAGLEAAAQIASPSKMTMALGQETGAGYALGIEQTDPMVTEAARRLATSSLESLGSDIESAFAAGRSRGEAVASGLASAEDLIGQTWDSVLGQLEGGPASEMVQRMRDDMLSGSGGGATRGGTSTNPADRIAAALEEFGSRLDEGLSRLQERPIQGEVVMDGPTTSRVVVGHLANGMRKTYEVGGGRRIR